MSLWVSEGFPVKQTMSAVEVNRSLYYYHKVTKVEVESSVKRGRPTPGYSETTEGKRICDEQIKEFLTEAIEGEAGVYGYRKLTHYLRVEHRLVINPKKVYRLCDELNILLPKRESQTVYPRRLCKQHVITRPNQMWQLDIKYGSIEGSGRFFFLASAIDIFDRCIVGYYRGPVCQAKDITAMLHGALMKRKIHSSQEESEPKLIIRTDNGPQFVSHHFGAFCEEKKIHHERIPPKSPNLNAYIESFHSIIERECYKRYRFECFDEAYYRIDEFMESYNCRRYHGSLKYLSPMQFHELYQEGEYPVEMAISI